jgi:hypothetical protein
MYTIPPAVINKPVGAQPEAGCEVLPAGVAWEILRLVSASSWGTCSFSRECPPLCSSLLSLKGVPSSGLTLPSSLLLPLALPPSLLLPLSLPPSYLAHHFPFCLHLPCLQFFATSPLPCRPLPPYCLLSCCALVAAMQDVHSNPGRSLFAFLPLGWSLV